MDTFLAGKKREKEIVVESQSDYAEWVDEVYTEIKVFVRRVNGLDLKESDDRHKLFSLTSKFAVRFRELRERSEASDAATDALIKLEELVERMDNASAPAAVTVATLSNDPFKKARMEKKREKREKKQIKRVHQEREEIAGKIQEVTAALEGEDS